MEYNKEFDVSGMTCPGPVMKVQEVLAGMAVGEILRIVTTDPGSVDDMSTLAEASGHDLLGQGRESSKFVIYLRKA